jgi:hypothetical protein
MRPAANILEAMKYPKAPASSTLSQQQNKSPNSLGDETKVPNDVSNTKTNVIEDTLKPTRSRFCQLLPVFIFLTTFASVLSLLIAYTFIHRSYSCKYSLPEINLHSTFFFHAIFTILFDFFTSLLLLRFEKTKILLFSSWF